MDQWLDSLSEEWVSQPRSSSSASVQWTSIVKGSSSAASKTSQSRIPRYQSRSSSNPATQSSTTSRPRTSTSKYGKDSKVLGERTSSNINAQEKRLFSGSTKFNQQLPGSKQLSGSRRHASTGSLPSLQQDTVQYRSPRASPNKEISQVTPEWRRRVLNGDVVHGEQRDLFSPIGLQGIFKPPTVRTKPQQKRGGKYQASTIEYFPSSPPPYPPVNSSGSVRTKTRARTSQTDVLQEMAILEEECARMPEHQPSKQVPDTPAYYTERTSPKQDDDVSNLGGRDMSSPESSSRTTAKRQQPQTQQTVDQPQKDTEERPPFTAYRANSGVDESLRCIASDVNERNRTFNGLEELHNEKISPVTLSRQSTADGRLHYEVPPCPAQPLRTGTKNASVQRQDRPSSPFSDQGVGHQWGRPEDGSHLAEIPVIDLTSQSLPDDLSVGTELFASKGGFVNLRRGGYSNDGSFQQRKLSPSSLPSSDYSAPRRQRQSDHGATNDLTTLPGTPSKSPGKEAANPERPRSSGSPLKLFGKYDTFTNDRLARRMSQFESSFRYSDHTDDNEDVQSGDEHAADRSSALNRVENVRARGPFGSLEEKRNRVSSFGEGRLDQYQFRQTGTSTSIVHQLDDAEEEIRPPLPELQRETHAFFKFTHESKAIRNSEGKRLPNSPAKDPKPKRRRTLHRSEGDSEALDSIESQVGGRAQIKHSVAGRKRKDARYDDNDQAMDPKLIAMRQILRPRTPTPSQVRSRSRKPFREMVVRSNEISEGAGEPTKNRKKTDVPPKDTPTELLAGQLATFALDIVNEVTYGNRKTSVTTQDFFNEAQQIMQHIRAQGRPQSGRTSADDSEAENLGGIEESGNEDSTKDEFSRPPSREGGSLRMARAPKRQDPRVLSHLRKFEEKDDLGLALSSSLKSLHIDRHGEDEEEQLGEIESDPPNIRIIGNSHKRKHSTSSVPELSAVETCSKSDSHKPQPSSGPSTGRSIPTGSSNGSGNRAVIGPDKVSHLISGHIAGMTFNRSRQVWVKRKTSNKQGANSPNNNASDETEEDPLGEIPDLSVDEIEELRRIQTAMSSVKVIGSISHGVAASDQLDEPRQQAGNSAVHGSQGGSELRRSDTVKFDAAQISSAPSKYSRFTCSGPKTETRATSWGDDVIAPKPQDTIHEEPQEAPLAEEQKHAEEVEHEISILEGRISTNPVRTGHGQRQARVITVAFSSPLVSHSRASNSPGQSEIREDDSELDLCDLPNCASGGEQESWQSSARRTSQECAARYRGAARRVSIGHRSYVARPITRIDEQDELSFLQPQNNTPSTSLDVAISTPMPLRDWPGSLSVPPPTTSRHSNVSFHLSPLPDFTMHKGDESFNRDVSYIVKHRGLLSLKDAGGKFPLAIEDLVKNITDIEPYEPYWDYIRKLDLQERNLFTLHMLDDFCGRIVKLDVSDNELGQLNGAPSSIRHLEIRRNSLSNMTAWSHLHNLQYLDVSGNQIQSLKGFSSLVHLRELRADDNHIESLDGILSLDGLITLRLTRNLVVTVDFEDTELKRLTELDLRGNKLRRVSNFHQLPALKSLDLSSNELETFNGDQLKQALSLQSLNLSRNSLASVDVSSFPNLASLNLDENRLSQIRGLDSVKQLENLSWREQNLVGIEDSSLAYNDCYEARNIYLSGNVLLKFLPEPAYLNLQHLELASSGLHDLPPEFGTKMSNLRVLNLNFNALKDIRPIIGVMRLQKLHLAGNRISRLRRTASVLTRDCRGLSVLDLRGNPLTVGFHAPPGAQNVACDAERQIVVKDRNRSNGVDDKDSAIAARYILPPADKDADGRYLKRLDEGTKLRRRVYEMLVVSGCKTLEFLDGLPLSRGKICRRDGVWEKLVELGVLRQRVSRDEEDAAMDK